MTKHEDENTGKSIPEELAPLDKQRAEALGGSVQQLAESAAAGDADGFDAAFNQLTQLAQNFDQEAFLNAIHIPAGAGEYAQEFHDMLETIPDNVGRWIECGQGWYPLIIDAHRKLLQLFPDYRVEQIKQKYGDLCYYWAEGKELYEYIEPSPDYPREEAKSDPDPVPADEEISDEQLLGEFAEELLDPTPEEVSPELEARREQWRKDLDAWLERRDAWHETDQAKEIQAERDRRRKLAGEVIREAEYKASRTCETCGERGHVCDGYWIEVLCPDHAKEKGVGWAEETVGVRVADMDGQTQAEAEEVICRIEAADPDQERQGVQVSFHGAISEYGREQPERELTEEFLAPIIEYVLSRRCRQAEEWGVDPSSALCFSLITDEAYELAAKLMQERGLRDMQAERLQAREEYEQLMAEVDRKLARKREAEASD